LFEGNKFGENPPPGIQEYRDKYRPIDEHNQAVFFKRDDPCVLQIGHRRENRPCYAPFSTTALEGKGALIQLAPGCKTVTVVGSQFLLPLFLNQLVRGRPLGAWLDWYAPEPMAALSSALFRPPSDLLDTVVDFHGSLQAKAPGSEIQLVTLHVRSQMLENNEYKSGGGADKVQKDIAVCVANWTSAVSATHVYIAADSGSAKRDILSHFERIMKSQGRKVNIISIDDLKRFSVKRHSEAMLVPDLAESLMLGRGRVCIGTARSTFSKIATTWWKGAFCDNIVEAPACSVVRTRNGGLPGDIVSSLFECDGRSCRKQLVRNGTNDLRATYCPKPKGNMTAVRRVLRVRSNSKPTHRTHAPQPAPRPIEHHRHSPQAKAEMQCCDPILI
jgi:hypothetical protein